MSKINHLKATPTASQVPAPVSQSNETPNPESPAPKDTQSEPNVDPNISATPLKTGNHTELLEINQTIRPLTN